MPGLDLSRRTLDHWSCSGTCQPPVVIGIFSLFMHWIDESNPMMVSIRKV